MARLGAGRRSAAPGSRCSRGRRLGRLGLATVCALAGLAYGALLDLSVMVTYGGEQSLDRYLALSARGLPFNVAHAAGNFAIALAAGPALVRMISRFRTRLEFTWRPAGGAAAGACSRWSRVVASPARPAATEARRDRALAWLVEHAERRRRLRRHAGPAVEPGDDRLGDARPRGRGHQPARPARAAARPRSPTCAPRPAGCARSATSSGRSSRSRPPGSTRAASPATTWSSELRRRRDGDGSVDGQVNLTAFYALALRAAGSRPGLARRAPAVGCAGPRTTTAAGGSSRSPRARRTRPAPRCRAWSRPGTAAARRRAAPRGCARPSAGGGGYALGGSGVINSQSTAWAIQGLAATGGSSGAVDAALSYLAHRRAADGHYRYSASSRPDADLGHRADAARGRAPAVSAPGGRPRRAREQRRFGRLDGDGRGGRSGAGQRLERRSSSTPSSSLGLGRGLAGRRGRRRRSRARRWQPTPNAERGSGVGRPATAATTAPRGDRGRGLARPAGGRRRRAATPVSVSYAPGATATLDDDLPAGGVRRAGAAGRGRLRLVPAPLPRVSAGRPARFVGDGRRDRDPHPAHPQGLPARAGRPRDARRAARARALGAQPPPDQPVALPGARAPRRSSGSRQAAGPEAAAKLDRAPTLVVCSCVLGGDPVQDEEDLAGDRDRRLHRPARRARARARRLLAHARACCARAAGRAAVGLRRRRAVRRADPPRPPGPGEAGRPSASRPSNVVDVPR